MRVELLPFTVEIKLIKNLLNRIVQKLISSSSFKIASLIIYKEENSIKKPKTFEVRKHLLASYLR